MELRPYQRDFCNAVLKDLGEHKRLLGVLPTGAGKTIVSAEILHRYNRSSLFLADAKELVYQAADKIQSWTGIIPDIEMGTSQACGSSPIIVGTTQSLARRLDKYYPEDIELIIIDEAHRNTLGSQALRVLNYFSRAKVLGITATPYRSDKKLLSSFYEKVSYEIDLFALIAQGYLSKIIVKSVPVNVDLKSVRSHGGDYDENDLAKVLSPHLRQCASLLKEHAQNRKAVVFLPLIETSKLFCKHCNELGLKAVHVDGNDRSLLNSDWNVICNASLLTMGWDEPSVAEKKAMTGKRLKASIVSGKPLSVEEFTAKKNPTEQPRNYGDCLGFVHDIQRWFIQSKERGIFDDMDVEQLAFERGKLKPVAEIYNEFNAMIRENKDFQKNNTTNQCNMNQNQVWAKN